ncbi:fucose permease [Aurantimicrobium minutum]|uniref:MFS transporter n=1 Tax=Aurantimicrobium minutum TaxID=708131 RepID=UPI00247331F8|nr:MFS transporter [Aurantimicrobium minutum]MDH6532942.1 fucose permease [Aurantimicrobium minutum]
MKRRTETSGRSWYWLVFTIFGIQGLFFATWVARTPEVQQKLGFDTAQMGLFAFVMSAGALLGLFLCGPIIARFGTRIATLIGFPLAGAALAGVGFAAEQGDVFSATVFISIFGIAGGATGLAINIEGANVDRSSSKSLLPSIHGAFSVGTLVGGALGTLAIILNLSFSLMFTVISVALSILAIVVSVRLPRDSGRHIASDMSTSDIQTIPSRTERLSVWKEPRTLAVAFIVVGFTLAEATASSWLPIALVDAGLGAAIATGAYTVFAGTMMIGRLTGGPVVDRLGRSRALAIFGVITAVGIFIVVATNFIALPLIGAALWGLGNSLGFPMSVAAVSREPRLSSSRVNVLVVSSNVTGVTGPPILGFIGQSLGLFTAFIVPALLVLAGLFANKSTQEHVQQIDQKS